MKKFVIKTIEVLGSIISRLLNFIGYFRASASMVMAFRRGFMKGRFKQCGNGLKIYSKVVIHSPENVELGSNVHIGDSCLIWGRGCVRIGSNTMIAAHSIITSQGHGVSNCLFSDTSLTRPVNIGNNVWIGAGVIVLPGVSISSNSIIGAGSVVVNDIPENVIAVGSPARVIKYIDNVESALCASG